MYTEERERKKSLADLKPDDIVKSCPYLETGSCFQLEGVTCCVHGSMQSPYIVLADEIKNKTITYEKIIERKTELFKGLNKLSDKDIGACRVCCNVVEKKYKDVCFEFLGGSPLPAAMNIQYYTECNERCLYCCYAQENNFQKPKYNILDYFNIFKERNKLRGNNWIDFSGGEPAMLKNFEEILNYMMDNQMGTVVVYSNSAIYSPAIYEGLKNNKIILTTSLDTGLCSTYKTLRGANVYTKVIRNLIRYRNSGTQNLWLKYVICNENRTDDDMWSFIMAMLAIRPNRVMICPDFPYGDKEIPDETVKFAAKLWFLLERLGDFTVGDYTSAMGDPKFEKYHKDLARELNDLKMQNSDFYDCVLKPLVVTKVIVQNSISNDLPKIKNPTFIQQVFSIRNEDNHKVMRVMGAKIKFKKQPKISPVLNENSDGGG